MTEERIKELIYKNGLMSLEEIGKMVAAEAREEGIAEAGKLCGQEIELLIVANECAHDNAGSEWRYTGRALKKSKAAVYLCVKRLTEKGR